MDLKDCCEVREGISEVTITIPCDKTLAVENTVYTTVSQLWRGDIDVANNCWFIQDIISSGQTAEPNNYSESHMYFEEWYECSKK